MQSDESLQILEAKKEIYINQLNGMKTSEMSFGEAKTKISNYVKAHEPCDCLISGDGSAWADITSVYTAPVTKYTQQEASPMESTTSRCCVAS